MIMTYENILISIDNNVATVTINRPKAYNVLNTQTLREIHACFIEDIRPNDAVRAVIIAGQGEKAFCGGADIKEMKDMNAMQAIAFSRLGQHTMAAIEDTPKPVVAAVNGDALGGGLELALACDMIVAAKHARFASPEINIGVMPGFGATKKLPQIVGAARAKELLFFGGMFDADNAYKLGIINLVVPAERLKEEAFVCACKLVEKSATALGLMKRVIDRSLSLDRETAALLEAEAFGACFATFDQKEGMNAFVEKRTPKFNGK
jgi:enoyl-CoA hydratase